MGAERTAKPIRWYFQLHDWVPTQVSHNAAGTLAYLECRGGKCTTSGYHENCPFFARYRQVMPTGEDNWGLVEVVSSLGYA